MSKKEHIWVFEKTKKRFETLRIQATKKLTKITSQDTFINMLLDLFESEYDKR